NTEAARVAFFIIKYDILGAARHFHGHTILDTFRAAIVRGFRDRLHGAYLDTVRAFIAFSSINCRQFPM
ncbi:MAG TPA: hypothetical protein PK307_13540, partial [Spirochaetota bacterium]|nr:hypothetical protein [Spirochaetota bacterium]